MLNIPDQQIVLDETSTVTVQVLADRPCPYCGTHETPEDRDGVWSCPNCGYPLTQDVPLIEEWETLISDQAEPLDEAGWAHLLQQAECLC